MRFAFAISGKRTTRDAVNVAQLVESQGIDEVWITEDYCERGAFAVAGAILAATSTLRVGIGVVNPWTRHPILTAMETAALSELAPDRVVLGLGTSNPRWMTEQLGIPFDQPMRRLRESVQMIRAALHGEHVDSDGVVGKVDVRLSTEISEVPIVLGVKGPRALAMAGEIADGVLLSVLSAPAYVQWAAAQMGDAAYADSIASYVAIEYGPKVEARERIRPFVARFLGIHGDHPITRVAGIEPELSAKFREGWRNASPRADLVSDAHLDTFVIAGDDDDIAEGIQRYAAAGLDTLVMHDQQNPDLERLLGVLSTP